MDGIAVNPIARPQRLSFGSSSSRTRDARAREETIGGGRQIGIARDPTAVAIEGPRPGMEDGEASGRIGRPLEKREIEGIGTDEIGIGRLAPTEDPAASGSEDNASRTADERSGDRKGLT